MYTCTKKYIDIPFAHRQHNHKGHCRLIHGHNWSFEFVFVAKKLDECGFVMDFGSLKWIKEWLELTFDHKLVLNKDDPALSYLENSLIRQACLLPGPFAEITKVPNCGAEGLAQYVFEQINKELTNLSKRVTIQSLTVYEDSKNSATYSINV
jgi:6-pyruvoyltetrahydropterin/6-carboxytetrahydropterin synthase